MESSYAVADPGFPRRQAAATYYYRPQTKFAKVMFSQVSVCPREGEVSAAPSTPRTRGRYTHSGRHPLPPPSACWGTVNKQAVRNPLECILVWANFPENCINNFKNWTEWGRVPRVPCDPPMLYLASWGGGSYFHTSYPSYPWEIPRLRKKT